MFQSDMSALDGIEACGLHVAAAVRGSRVKGELAALQAALLLVLLICFHLGAWVFALLALLVLCALVYRLFPN
jgi:hypothetical protein